MTLKGCLYEAPHGHQGGGAGTSKQIRGGAGQGDSTEAVITAAGMAGTSARSLGHAVAMNGVGRERPRLRTMIT